MLTAQKRKKIFRVISILWAVVIISISSIPRLSVPNIQLGFRLDYIMHFGIYFVLALFIFLWKADKEGHFNIKQNLVFIMCLCLFAIADETHQRWIPGRTFAWQDMVSNMLGLTIAFGFVPYLYKRYCIK